MRSGKLHFGVGLVAGIASMAFLLLVFAPRYTTITQDGTIVKSDRWTGKSWRYQDDTWLEIKRAPYDWKPVDAALRKALSLPETTRQFEKNMALLKDTYPELKKIPDEDLLERIKIVYSGDFMQQLYLQRFLDTYRNNKNPGASED
ncbi:MAG: hypothetical protein WCZ16_13115 [Desulfosarcinaceae bacterium]|jgi:hypothetical protein